jgi:heme-degrading monooxygenase HmoA
MKSPWKWTGTLDPDQEYVVLASAIPAKSRRSTWRMFNGSRIVRKQLGSTDGVIGFALLARPIAKDYATLSIWRDEAALSAFAGTEPHKEMMSALAPEMGPTKFVRWTIKGSDGKPSWDDALARLR